MSMTMMTVFPGRKPTGPEANTITILYENLSAEIGARALLEYACSQLNLPDDLGFDCWKFDSLQEPDIENQALSRACHSRIVVLSASNLRDLPSEVEGWLGWWMDSRIDRASALFVLLPEARRASRATEAAIRRLQRASEERGLGFLCEFYDEPLSVDGSSAAMRSSPFEPEIFRVHRIILMSR